MILTILIVFFTIVALLVLHELGHFLTAKKFGVKVEEFGVGYPPRIWGKKVGETLYSINALPFGAFVKMVGEEEKVKEQRSFSEKSLGERALILLGGVISFWLVAVVILMVVAWGWGVPTGIPDHFTEQKFTKDHVEILQVASGSPAKRAGLERGDLIQEIRKSKLETQKIDKVGEVQRFVSEHQGEELVLTVKRGEEVLEVGVLARTKPPADQGPLGIGLARVANLQYPWYEVPGQSFKIVGQQTITMPVMLGKIVGKFLQGKKPKGVRISGPIGIGQLMGQALGQGVERFLLMVVMISVWLALFNLFPIPALDGGKLLFLGIEGVRGRPVSEVVEQKITTLFFFLLIGLMILVTIKDISRLF